MRTSPKLTRHKLLKRLRQLLLQTDTKVQFKELSEIANVSWDIVEDAPANICINIDSIKAGAIECVIHELLHVALAEYLTWADPIIEEEIVLRLDKWLSKYINDSWYQTQQWRKAVESRTVK